MDIYNLPFVRLKPHPTARDQAVAVTSLTPGTIIVSSPSLSTILLPSDKGKRCDGCHVLRSPNIELKKCSACSKYWYCGTKCNVWLKNYLLLHPETDVKLVILVPYRSKKRMESAP